MEPAQEEVSRATGAGDHGRGCLSQRTPGARAQLACTAPEGSPHAAPQGPGQVPQAARPRR